MSLLLTLIAYELSRRIYRRLPLGILLPIAISPVLIILALIGTDTSYSEYISGAQLISGLLGPATVALAIPLYKNIRRLRERFVDIIAGVCAGTLWGGLTGILFGYWLGLEHDVIRSLTLRSITTPIAMEASEAAGADPALTGAFVIVTGIFGASIGPWLTRLLGLKQRHAVGVMFGTGAHGAGTARALELDAVSGAYSSVAMTLAAVLGSLLLPHLPIIGNGS